MVNGLQGMRAKRAMPGGRGVLCVMGLMTVRPLRIGEIVGIEMGGGVQKNPLFPAGSSRCPRWDSNPHCADFEAASSTNWDTGAYPNLE